MPDQYYNHPFWKAFARKDVHGILGLSWSNASHSPAILKTLTQRARPDWRIDNKKVSYPLRLFEADQLKRSAKQVFLKPIKFSIVSGAHRGEVHFGGHDPAATIGNMRREKVARMDTHNHAFTLRIKGLYATYTPARNMSDENSSNDSGNSPVTFSTVSEELWSTPPSLTSAAGAAAIFDTGSACTALPADLYMALRRSELAEAELTFEFAGGTNLTISTRQLGCVIQTTGTALLGAAWFQAYLIEFGIGDSHQAVGFGKINPSYHFVPAPKDAGTVRKLGFEVNLVSSQFIATVGLGTPKQTVSLILDTGSPMLAVRCDYDQVHQIVATDIETKGKLNRQLGSGSGKLK